MALYPHHQNPQLLDISLWNQQDGAPSHYALHVREYLVTMFPKRWIGRRGFVEWPARSLDLTPLDFFVAIPQVKSLLQLTLILLLYEHLKIYKLHYYD